MLFSSIYLSAFFPFFLPLLELLGVSFFSKSSTDFFKAIVEKIRAQRDTSGEVRLKDIPVYFDIMSWNNIHLDDALFQMTVFDLFFLRTSEIFSSTSPTLRLPVEQIKKNSTRVIMCENCNVSTPMVQCLLLIFFLVHPDRSDGSWDHFSSHNAFVRWLWNQCHHSCFLSL